MDYDEAIAVFFAPAPEGVATPAAVTGASPSRRLRDALEPLSMHGVWAPRVNRALAEHGYDFFTAYVRGRGAPLGEVPSSVVAATFAVFEPGVVDALWTAGQGLLPLPELIALRDRETTASLRELLSPVADEDEVGRLATTLEGVVDGLDGTGRVLFSALRSQPRLPDPYARAWRAADLIREHRGDSHIAACVAAGLDPVRMGILMEVWLGYPVGEYSGTRAWPQEAADAGLARLEADGLVASGAITAEGRRVRDAIEAATDLAQQGVVDALGLELDTVAKQLDVLSQRCVETGTFPPDVRKRAAG
ncbi:MAG: SCO6745 family protein [Pseudonocardia sp.]